MISEEKTVGLCTGYRIVKGVNILQSQRCSSSSTCGIETYPARRKRFSKLTRATQQEQAISVWKSVVSIESRFDTNSSSTNAQKHFWVKLYSSFLSQLQVYRTTKIFWVHILRCLAKDMKLFTPQVKNTCIEMSCIKMTSNPHTIFVLKISRQDNTISIWSLAPAGTYMFYKNKKIMWVISKHNCTWISDWIYVTMGSLSLYRWYLGFTLPTSSPPKTLHCNIALM